MEKSSINSAMIFQEMIRKAEQQIKNLERNELVSIEITVREKDPMFGYDGLITEKINLKSVDFIVAKLVEKLHELESALENL